MATTEYVPDEQVLGNQSKAAALGVSIPGLKTPTVLSDTNIRDNVIPEIQKTASSMLDYDKNPYYIRPGETMDAYKARTGITAALGGNEQQGNEQTDTPPENEYDSLYQSVMGTTPAKDDFYDKDLELIKAMQKTSDARTSNQLAGITAQFDLRAKDMSRAQASQGAATNAALMRSGASRYAPANAAGIMGAQQRGFIRELSSLDLEEAQAKNEALAAQEDNNYKLLGAKLDTLKEKRAEKLDVVNKMYDSMVDEKKQTQKDITDLLKDAAKNGAPQEITNAIASSQSVGEAMQAAGDYLQTATGTPGEYLYYKRDAIAHGQVPMSYNEYADMDANRKRSIVNMNAGGLTTREQQTYLTITNKYQADPIINAAIKAGQVKQVADAVIADPNNTSNQLASLYLFVKNLDPDSAVREGELGLAQATQSYTQKFNTQLTRLSKGQVISPQAAKELAIATKALVATWEATAEKKTRLYRSQAKNASPNVGDSFDGYINDYTESNLPEKAIEDEKAAQQEVIDYGHQHPELQETISNLVGDVNPDTGQPYSWADIKQIYGIGTP